MNFTEDWEEAISNSGITFFNDCDESVMEIWEDGELIRSITITDYMESKGKTYEDFLEDKQLVYDTFIDESR